MSLDYYTAQDVADILFEPVKIKLTGQQKNRVLAVLQGFDIPAGFNMPDLAEALPLKLSLPRLYRYGFSERDVMQVLEFLQFSVQSSKHDPMAKGELLQRDGSPYPMGKRNYSMRMRDSVESPLGLTFEDDRGERLIFTRKMQDFLAVSFIGLYANMVRNYPELRVRKNGAYMVNRSLNMPEGFDPSLN